MEYMKKGAIFSSNYWAEEMPGSKKKPTNILSEAKARKYFSQLLSALDYCKKTEDIKEILLINKYIIMFMLFTETSNQKTF